MIFIIVCFGCVRFTYENAGKLQNKFRNFPHNLVERKGQSTSINDCQALFKLSRASLAAIETPSSASD